MRRRSNVLILTLSLFAFSLVASAQEEGVPEIPPSTSPAVDTYLDGMVGTWSTTGTIEDTTFTETRTNEWVLGHQYLLCQSTSLMTLPDGSTVTWDGWLMYDPLGEGRYQQFYADSDGRMELSEAWTEGENLISEWEAGENAPKGRSVRSPNPDGTVTETMYVEGEDGTLLVAGTSTMTRITD